MQLTCLSRFRKICLRAFALVFLGLFFMFAKMPWLFYAYDVSAIKQRRTQDIVYFTKDTAVFKYYLEHSGIDYYSRLVHEGISLDEVRDRHGNSFLHLAMLNDNQIECKWLIEHGMNPNDKNNFGWTPLDRALFRGGEAYAYLEECGGRHSWKYIFWFQKVDLAW